MFEEKDRSGGCDMLTINQKKFDIDYDGRMAEGARGKPLAFPLSMDNRGLVAEGAGFAYDTLNPGDIAGADKGVCWKMEGRPLGGKPLNGRPPEGKPLDGRPLGGRPLGGNCGPE